MNFLSMAVIENNSHRQKNKINCQNDKKEGLFFKAAVCNLNCRYEVTVLFKIDFLQNLDSL